MTNLKDSFSNLQYINRNGYQYFLHPMCDGTSTILPTQLKEFARWANLQLNGYDVTHILTAEAMGIPIAAAVSLETGIPMVIARKREYNLPGELKVQKSTGYSMEHIYINGLFPGDRVVFIDDVLDTGGTVSSIASALTSNNVSMELALFLVSKKSSPTFYFPCKSFVEIE